MPPPTVHQPTVISEASTSHGPSADWASHPSSARLYNHLLGGKDCYEADRTLAATLTGTVPNLPTAAQINRAFGHRAVRLMADRGIAQFLDLGCGLPYGESLHETAAARHPDGMRFLYVDHDPHVIAHAQALMTAQPPAVAAHLLADIRQAETVLSSPEAAEVLVPGRPVGVVMHTVLHLLGDDAVSALLAALRDWLPPGSCLSLTHPAADLRPQDARYEAVLCAAAGLPLRQRTRREVADLLGGLELLEPGIAPTGAWLPDHLTGELPLSASAAWAAIAAVP
ncbi:SAM-dependent methyltransferase [Streptomyces nanhaiensis]|uniref:SAM-dependent methyltransferase n=1 Tax=Streptomyces nanhaiensis TaxID=679319 RepID=UPI00399C79A1